MKKNHIIYISLITLLFLGSETIIRAQVVDADHSSPGVASAYEVTEGYVLPMALYKEIDKEYKLFAYVEIKGRITFTTQGILSGEEGFLRLQLIEAKDKWIPITKRELVEGKVIITTEDGKKYSIFNLGIGDFAAQIQVITDSNSNIFLANPIDTQNNSVAELLMTTMKERKSEEALAYAQKIDSVNYKDRMGNSLLTIAAGWDYKDICMILVEKGADVDYQLPEGSTALMLACQNGYYDIASILLENGANIELKRNDDKTAIYLAYRRGHKEIVDLLISKGAKLDSKLPPIIPKSTAATTSTSTTTTDVNGPAATTVKKYLAAASKLDPSLTKEFLSTKCEGDIVTEFKENSNSGWLFSPWETKFKSELVDTIGKKATVVVDMVYSGGATYMGNTKTFTLLFEEGVWKVSKIDPAPKNTGPGVSPLR